MPLDVQTKLSLLDRVQMLGVQPVPHDVWWQHMQAELNKRPGDWGFHHQNAFVGLLITAATLLGAGVGIGLCIDSYILASICIVCLLAFVIRIATGYRFKGPARWVESYVSVHAPNVIPEQINKIAIHLRTHIPDAWLMIGELDWENVVIDPYLLICSDGEQSVCLGIWEDAMVYHTAMKHD